MQVHQSRDKPYLYTLNPSPISHKSNKLEHHLKIVDFYIQKDCPKKFIVEPVFGKYEPDIFFTDVSGKNICVEIQITPLSITRMQKKIDDFVSEFNKTHDSRIMVLCSDTSYPRLKIPKDFKLVKHPLPKEPTF